MLNEIEIFEKQVKEQVERNEKLIADYAEWMKQNKLSEKTINKHLNNVSLFANDFLLYSEITPIEKGHIQIDYYFDYWFKRKVMSSVTDLKENITSIKKFYTYLNSVNKISKIDLDEMNFYIKKAKGDWIKNANNYFDDLMEDY